MKIAAALAVMILIARTGWGQQVLTSDSVMNMQKAGEDFVLIDVRNSVGFQSKHIVGAINVARPFILKAQLSKSKKVVLYCESPTCGLSYAAAKDLIGAGYADVSVLDGGLSDWQAKSYPLSAPPTLVHFPPIKRISARELNAQLSKNPFVILDVRSVQEYRAGHIPGAMNIPLESLPGQISSLNSLKKMIVYDKNEQRSQGACKLIQAQGLPVEELSGGIPVWVAMRFRISI